ncbi:MAG: hypothetical protein K2N87_01660 [Eubacterium sp.]|nr:hypothetical protein [Eubacterium sp.]
MIHISIAEKDFKAVCHRIPGRRIKEDTAVYNEIFGACIHDKKDMVFVIYDNRENINEIENGDECRIFGIDRHKQLLLLGDSVSYLYTIELMDDARYSYNNYSFLTGKVKVSKRYNFNFEYHDYTEKRKATFLDFLDSVQCNMEGIWAETYAVSTYNMRLFSNICKYKGEKFDNYQKYFQDFYREAKKGIRPVNAFREELMCGMQEVKNMYDLSNYIKSNRKKFLDKSEELCKRNDSVKNVYPVNMAGRCVCLDLYDGILFNSSLPFYFQYRNYKYAAQYLAELFYKEITERESRRMKKPACQAAICHEEKDSANLYGLYFPLLMVFRQSVELAYKLLFVNEVIKKYNGAGSGLHEQIKKLDTHDLLQLLELLANNLESDEYKYLWQMSSFIYYNEDMDVSFSRYLTNYKFELDKFKRIWIYYHDIYCYVQEFYPIMDGIISRKQMGFNKDEIF